MPEQKKWFLRPRTLLDLLLGAVCIGLLLMMLAQLDALKKIEAEVDRLRVQVEAGKGAPPAERAPETGPAAEQKKP